MAQRGRPRAAIELTDEERRVLQQQARRRKSSHQLAYRSRIVLLAADGVPDTEIARRIGRSRDTVGIWRRRFVRHRLEGLH